MKKRKILKILELLKDPNFKFPEENVSVTQNTQGSSQSSQGSGSPGQGTGSSSSSSSSTVSSLLDSMLNDPETVEISEPGGEETENQEDI